MATPAESTLKAEICLETVMRITLDLDEDLVAAAKALAASENKTLTRLIEEALAEWISRRAVAANREIKPLRVYHGKGGLLPTVADSLTNRALFDAADAEDDA